MRQIKMQQSLQLTEQDCRKTVSEREERAKSKWSSISVECVANVHKSNYRAKDTWQQSRNFVKHEQCSNNSINKQVSREGGRGVIAFLLAFTREFRE
jgi:hypothetical protein